MMAVESEETFTTVLLRNFVLGHSPAQRLFVRRHFPTNLTRPLLILELAVQIDYVFAQVLTFHPASADVTLRLRLRQVHMNNLFVLLV
jgi:hypothetical protein